MSFFTIATYLQKLSQKSERVQSQMDMMAERIGIYESLLAREKELRAENNQLMMDCYTLESMAARVTEEREERTAVDGEARQAYTNLLQLCEQLKRIDFDVLAKGEMQTQQLEFQEELHILKEQAKKKRQLYEEMENRPVVQELRKQQRIHAAAKEQLERTKRRGAEEISELTEQLNATRKEYQQVIVTLAGGALELQRLRDKKANAKAWTVNVFKKPNAPVAATALRSFDPHKPFAFGNAVFNQAKTKFPSLANFVQDLKITWPIQKTVELRSILRPGQGGQQESSPTVSKVEQLAKPKRVHFMPSDNDRDSSSDESRSPSMHTAPEFKDQLMPILKQSSRDAQCATFRRADVPQMRPERCAQKTTATISKIAFYDNNQAGQVDGDYVSETDSEPLSRDEPSNDQQLVVSASDEEAEQDMQLEDDTETERSQLKSGGDIEIQDCQVIKPAGTPLPLTLPVNLSPATLVSLKRNESSMATTSNVEKQKRSLNQDRQNSPSPTNNFNTEYDQSGADDNNRRERKQIDKTKKQTKKEQMMDFDSFLRSEPSQLDSEDGDGLDMAKYGCFDFDDGGKTGDDIGDSMFSYDLPSANSEHYFSNDSDDGMTSPATDNFL